MSKTPLARAFLSALVDAASPDGSAEMRRDAAAILDSIAVEEALEERLHATLGEVRQRWPDVNLAQDRYFAYVAERATKAANSSIPEQVLRALERLNLPDLYLACSCADGQPNALRAFDREILSRVPVFVSRLRLSEAQVEDVRLALRERLLVMSVGGSLRLTGFTGQGSLVSWVRIAALRLALNQRRDKDEHHAPEEQALAAAAGQDAEVEYLRRNYKEQFQGAVRAAFASLPDEQRNLLYLYYVDQLNTRQIARLFQVNNTTASRWLVAAREHIGDEVRRSLREKLRISNEELQSLYRVVRSYLEVSLRTVLTDDDGPLSPARRPPKTP